LEGQNRSKPRRNLNQKLRSIPDDLGAPPGGAGRRSSSRLAAKPLGPCGTVGAEPRHLPADLARRGLGAENPHGSPEQRWRVVHRAPLSERRGDTLSGNRGPWRTLSEAPDVHFSWYHICFRPNSWYIPFSLACIKGCLLLWAIVLDGRSGPPGLGRAEGRADAHGLEHWPRIASVSQGGVVKVLAPLAPQVWWK